jgi:hypothetical protein
MQQSSSSIGALATALAKAQIELVNPEKSMIATIGSHDKGRPEQTFRYAPLSSGLEILRKALGQHEIAILQTTGIDQAAGVVKLTTTLCHSSGEWVGSTWPVCSVEEMASPKRMGAALTYARRYALFALVGIAGEDDLDAPDLNAPEEAPPNRRNRPNGGRNRVERKIRAGHDEKGRVGSANAVLKSQLSAVLREELLGELKDIDSVDAAAIWARRILPAKNSLHVADARQLENAFQVRLAQLELGVDKAKPQPSPFGSIRNHATSLEQIGPQETFAIERIEKRSTAHREPRRLRDREHLKFVAGRPLFDLRSPSGRSSPSQICTNPSTWTKGE